ncbi:cytochrome p450 [Trichoderma cornu-damae]|uniref:Cytochrome p450 n=1 Tax=Trichoderma cornu-damae TaxID=654480 RepID=A0A9P8TW26_9HYPO|nr:cytochrome p450 [Trichoderma cornu-damae]
MTIGPVVRINPHELHCNDPKFLDTLYPSGVKNREKAMTFTRDHQLHRKRRATLIKFFSRSRILKLQDDIQARVQKLCDKLLASRGGKGSLAQSSHMFPIDRIKRLDNKDFEKQRETVFSSMLQYDLPASEKSTERLAADAAVLLNAGTDTTARTLSVLTFYLLDKPQICAKVRTELETIVEDPTHLPQQEVLEKLPYLSGVILGKVSDSAWRFWKDASVAPDEDMVYRGVWNSTDVTYVIPRGWAIGTSSPLIHTHESISLSLWSSYQKRWLDENNHRRRDLEDHPLYPFGKGSRED